MGLSWLLLVEQTFNIGGKETKVLSTKHFPIDFSVSVEDNNLYGSSINPYVVNKGVFLK